MTAEQIAGWDEELTELTGSLGRLFNRPEPRVVFAQYVEELLAELPKKNGWTLSERAGHLTPDRMQWLLNGSVWDADRLRDAVRDYVLSHLGDADASLVIDDTQSQKKGTKSVGVAFQHCGLTGDVRNCQTMVMLTYATAAGHAFIDRRLYLPEEWTADRERCREAGVPDEVAFATKPELAIAMLEQARAACVPFTWVLADAGYGRDPQLRAWCQKRVCRRSSRRRVAVNALQYPAHGCFAGRRVGPLRIAQCGPAAQKEPIRGIGGPLGDGGEQVEELRPLPGVRTCLRLAGSDGQAPLDTGPAAGVGRLAGGLRGEGDRADGGPVPGDLLGRPVTGGETQVRQQPLAQLPADQRGQARRLELRPLVPELEAPGEVPQQCGQDAADDRADGTSDRPGLEVRGDRLYAGDEPHQHPREHREQPGS
ncbi:IS701 family transposase [Streptomyces sp. NPDC059169]|uniref:IS701 family transposase n=1 Tax=unclassified Streptomyces TaxID=2593676 RepID=UPI0036A338BD